ncbi:MAG: biotin--[Clostridia bacterium]|nr:biotin--[acetyl-CoA-carboxylase] ligase [Clostridia bacterium]
MYIREHFTQIPSTNDYAKEKRAEGRNRLITADMQTGGRGTKGRSFSSDEGGVYVTKLDFYENFSAKNAFMLMAGAAVAVCKTLVSFGVKPVIKWANDIHVNGKKICGILIENTFSGDKIRSSVVGVGLNVCNALPDELSSIATTLCCETGKKISVAVVRERLIEELCKPHTIGEYLAYIGYMHTEAELIFADRTARGRLLAVDETGGLLVEIEGKKERLTAAEVSVRTGGV